ncbi:MAG: hypothetical protein HYW95_03310 [Candidatus Wildermuthbacteria bacterium]|nr:hypothetical protein [Candidatus Wildermuthbacteria bacterium]
MDNFQLLPKKESELKHYLKLISQKNKIIFGLAVGAMIVAGGLSSQLSTSSKVEAVFQVGTIDGAAIESPQAIIEKVRANIYISQLQASSRVDDTELRKMRLTNPPATNLIKIEINSTQPDRAKDTLQALLVLMGKDLEKRINAKKESWRTEIAFLEDDIKLMNEAIKRLDGEIQLLEGERKSFEQKERIIENSNPYDQVSQRLSGSVFMLLDTREKIDRIREDMQELQGGKERMSSSILSLQRQISLFRDKLSNNVESPLVLKDPVVSQTSKQPGMLMNTVVAGILGLVAGTTLVFAREWWKA